MQYIVPLGIVLVVVFILIGIYNSLIGRRNQVKNAFSSIDVMLKKRFDLLPNLIETVKQYAGHEKEVLENIVELRNGLEKADLSSSDRMAMENKLTSQISALNLTVENYPDLKASENFLNLQRNLTEIESQLSASRRTYNASVLDLNNGLEKFPSNIIGNMFGFEKEAFFETPEAEKANVNVKALFDN
ncbi:MAG: LemA family protein [Flavobacteriales bacterium]